MSDDEVVKVNTWSNQWWTLGGVWVFVRARGYFGMGWRRTQSEAFSLAEKHVLRVMAR